MAFSVKHEHITPAMAEAWLKLSAGNRFVNPDHVLAYGVDMEAGRWDADASEIVFDEDGKLIDGHHRLEAVKAVGKTVTMLVKRGVAKSARSVIDTGRSRNVVDIMSMYRPDVKHARQRRSYVGVCAALLVGAGRAPIIKTLGAYDAWLRHFRDGIDWVVSASVSLPTASIHKFRMAPIAGAFAFAHKTNPTKVERFFERCGVGEGLSRDEAAFTIRNHILAGHYQHTGGGRAMLAEKVLNAIYADLKGSSLKKSQAGAVGLEFFRQVYDTKGIQTLMAPWIGDADPEARQAAFSEH